MPKIAYQARGFRPDTLGLIERVNGIIAEYQRQGYTLTLRQVYYQLVARTVIPNRDTEYKRLGAILNDARLAGLVDWGAIVDRTRSLRRLSHWEDPAGVIESAMQSYRRDKWADQPNRVEVWIEKDALVGVIADVCERNDVPYFSCRGYTSQSEMWAAGQRLIRYHDEGQQPVIVHLGDHDPSGIDMTRDIAERLTEFVAFEVDAAIEVRRIALNMDQVERYQPPPNPAKLTDSRAIGYIAEHGGESWELDALEPTVIGALVEETIAAYRDADVWAEAVEAERDGTAKLALLSRHWPQAEGFLAGLNGGRADA